MAREAEQFSAGAGGVAERRNRLLTARARGVGARGGVYYGLSAFGYPLGAIAGVSQGGAPPATEALGEQFVSGDSGGDAGSGGSL